MPLGEKIRVGGGNYPTNDSRYALPETTPQEPIEAQWDWRTSPVGPDGDVLPPNAFGWRPDGTPDFGVGLEGWWKKAYYNVQNAWNKGWNSGMDTVEKNEYQTDILPRFTAALETTKAIGAEVLWGGLSALGEVSIGLERLAGAIALPLRDISQGRQVGGGDYWQNNWEASRLTYNILVDGFKGKQDVIRQEFADRLLAGERPDLIAEDMLISGKASPWPEFWGQLIFDPFNADLFANWFSKSRKAVSIVAKAQKAFGTIENPALRELVEAAAGGGGKVSGSKAFQEAFGLYRQTAGETGSMVDRLKKPGLIAHVGLPARSRQVSNLISDSRRLFFRNRMGTVIEDVVRRTGADAGEILDVFDAMTKAAKSDNLADAAEGFRHLMEYKNPAILLSEAGNELAAVVGELVKRHGKTWFADIAKAGSTENVAELLLKNLDGVLDDIFPSAEDMLKASDKAKELTKAGEVVPAAVQRLADKANDMTGAERVIARMHSDLQAGVVGKLNRAFSNLYLNWSPAYAFRNGIQNNLQLFLDYGPAAFVSSADSWIGKANKLNGVELLASGFDPATALVGKAKASSIKTGLIPFMKDMFKGARVASGNAETNAARRIVGSQYVKTFKQGLDPMISGLAKDTRFRNLDPEVWATLKNAILDNFGDVNKAMDDVIGSIDNRSVNLFQDYEKIPKGLKDFIVQIGKEDEVRASILRAKNKTEALSAVDGLFDELDDAGRASALDGMQHTPGDALSDLTAAMQEEGAVSDARGLLINAQRQVANEARSQLTLIMDRLTSDLAKQGIAIPPEVGGAMRQFARYGEDTSNSLQALKDAVIPAIHSMTDANIPKRWNALKKVLPGLGDAPVSRSDAVDQLWKAIEDNGNAAWVAERKTIVENVPTWLDEVEQSTGVVVPPQYRESVKAVLDHVAKWDNISVGEMGMIFSSATPLQGSRVSQINQLAKKYGIASADYAGIPRDKYTLNIINKYAGVDFKSLDDPIDLAMANRALAKKAGVAEEAVTTAKQLEPLIPPYKDGTMPTYARMLKENNLDTARTGMRTYVENNFGRLKSIAVDPRVGEQLSSLIPELTNRLNTIRTVSTQVAQEARNFTLLNYGEKTYWDVASAYLMPYGFWYKGTYNNWIQRLANNPAIFAGYAKYKQAMQLSHAGLPDWWKQNIQIDSVLGIDLEHPLFFNLEATLNPLNGLTGTDFNDPEKATTWFTSMLDQLGKFGPSTWSPFNIATGLVLRAQGHTEEGNAWIGRVIPQTALVKTWTGVELDPAVAFLMGGHDKYERRRIGRALSEMVAQGLTTQEDAIEADRLQEGPLWEQAAQLANSYRQAGQTMSSLFGVGFKARSEADMQIDQFDAEWRKVMTLRPNMSPEDFRNNLANLGEKYPFMDTVLISRKTGPDRDLAYAYNTLGRLQPGDASELLKQVGVSNEVVSRFYENKGDMSSWTEGDRMRFMAAMIDLGAITKLPDLTTRQEWNATRGQFAAMRSAVEQSFGKDIYAQIDDYYAAQAAGNGDKFLDAFPAVAEALQAENAYKANNELLATYYGGIEVIQRYYTGQFRADMERRFGENIYDVYYEYLGEVDQKLKNQIYRANPKLRDFIRARSSGQDAVNRNIARLGSMLPDEPNTPVRVGASVTQNLLGETINAPPVSAVQLRSEMTTSMQRLVDAYFRGIDLPYAVRQQLDYIGDRHGLTANEVLQIVGAG